MPDLVEALKQAIAASSKSRYEVANEAEVSHSVLTRFVNGDRDITLTTASKIAAVLNLGFAPLPTRKKKR